MNAKAVVAQIVREQHEAPERAKDASKAAVAATMRKLREAR